MLKPRPKISSDFLGRGLKTWPFANLVPKIGRFLDEVREIYTWSFREPRPKISGDFFGRGSRMAKYSNLVQKKAGGLILPFTRA